MSKRKRSPHKRRSPRKPNTKASHAHALARQFDACQFTGCNINTNCDVKNFNGSVNITEGMFQCQRCCKLRSILGGNKEPYARNRLKDHETGPQCVRRSGEASWKCAQCYSKFNHGQYTEMDDHYRKHGNEEEEEEEEEHKEDNINRLNGGGQEGRFGFGINLLNEGSVARARVNGGGQEGRFGFGINLLNEGSVARARVNGGGQARARGFGNNRLNEPGSIARARVNGGGQEGRFGFGINLLNEGSVARARVNGGGQARARGFGNNRLNEPGSIARARVNGGGQEGRFGLGNNRLNEPGSVARNRLNEKENVFALFGAQPKKDVGAFGFGIGMQEPQNGAANHNGWNGAANHNFVQNMSNLNMKDNEQDDKEAQKVFDFALFGAQANGDGKHENEAPFGGFVFGQQKKEEQGSFGVFPFAPKQKDEAQKEEEVQREAPVGVFPFAFGPKQKEEAQKEEEEFAFAPPKQNESEEEEEHQEEDLFDDEDLEMGNVVTIG
eukprot:44907_1